MVLRSGKDFCEGKSREIDCSCNSFSYGQVNINNNDDDCDDEASVFVLTH